MHKTFVINHTLNNKVDIDKFQWLGIIEIILAGYNVIKVEKLNFYMFTY